MGAFLFYIVATMGLLLIAGSVADLVLFLINRSTYEI